MMIQEDMALSLDTEKIRANFTPSYEVLAAKDST
jgi:hypothetical protein